MWIKFVPDMKLDLKQMLPHGVLGSIAGTLAIHQESWTFLLVSVGGTPSPEQLKQAWITTPRVFMSTGRSWQGQAYHSKVMLRTTNVQCIHTAVWRTRSLSLHYSKQLVHLISSPCIASTLPQSSTSSIIITALISFRPISGERVIVSI